MKVYITKYALTSGVIEIEAEELCASSSKGSIRIKRGPMNEFFHGEGKEWHKTKESARLRIQEMKSKKIASLIKQIKYLN